MKNRRNVAIVLLPLLLAIGVGAGIFIGRYITTRTMTPKQEKLKMILSLIESDYVDKLDIDSLIETTFPELLTSLDPHSAYIPAEELQTVNDDLSGSFSGVGVSFQVINDTVQVIEVVAGGPAEKVGILPGDRIIYADTISLTGKDISSQDVFKTLRGEKGSTVVLTIKRFGQKKNIVYDVVRGDIPVNSVDVSYMLNENVGYVKVTKFSRNTYMEFFNALNDLRQQGADSFIIDLRGNSGGFMDQAIFMANEFLPAGRLIVYTRGRKMENEYMAMSDGRGNFQDYPIVVLTNESSASASEIFAGAIQDNDRGLIIGRRTFGKGLVQNQTELPDSSAIRLTVARYYTPSGRSIQKEFKRGEIDKYEMDIVDRYSHGEFYNADSIKFDKEKVFQTTNGRKVYGGGGIMPDIFVPEDTTGFTSYYMSVANQGLIPKYAISVSDEYREKLGNDRSIENLNRILPPDQLLLENFVAYAVKNGVPARWYYITKSRDLLISQLKAVIARDVLGYPAFIELLNENDNAVLNALDQLREGHSPVNILNQEESEETDSIFSE
ncbi:MAG: S41 family peptidase [Muribaculaceae bacterium]|nr:S41 family peptidase [Muribaculaceae bacterium]